MVAREYILAEKTVGGPEVHFEVTEGFSTALGYSTDQIELAVIVHSIGLETHTGIQV